MLVTNQTTQDYWFGPLHLAAGVGSTLTVDDTSDTSIYLLDDAVADSLNSLYAAGSITVSGAASPFPRPTGTPEIVHGDGSPEGIQFASQGSLYLRRDGDDSWRLYVKNTGAAFSDGWLALPGQELDYAEIDSDVTGITATSEGTSQTVIGGNDVYYTTSRVKVSFFIPEMTGVGSPGVIFVVYRDSDVVGQVSAANAGPPTPCVLFETFDTPDAGVHAYSVNAFVDSGTLTVKAGPGGSGNLIPGWLRVTKA